MRNNTQNDKYVKNVQNRKKITNKETTINNIKNTQVK